MLTLPPSAFRAIADIARAEAGLNIEPGKAAMVEARVRRRLRFLGLADYDRYCALLAGTSDAARRERRNLINAMTTNVTAFFRERHHFDLLADHVARRLAPEPRREIAIWSAGASDGSEAVSAVLAILEACPHLDPARLRVLATDIDDGAVAAARAGRYRLAALGAEDRARHARHIEEDADGTFGLRPALHRCVEVRRHNLAGPTGVGGTFDVVLCRNVLIYFDDDVKRQVQDRLVRAVRPGGLLCLGHSERLLVAGAGTDALPRVGITTFQRDLPGRRLACQ